MPESDDLEGARHTLKTGYGQSKWVAEKLLFECGRRGLRGAIIRPGYVVGDSKSAVTNTDDFIWRLVKGCVQLGLVCEFVRKESPSNAPEAPEGLCCMREKE